VWAHGLFFVPESSRIKLLEKLENSISKYPCEKTNFHFSDISGKRIAVKDGSIIIRDWVNYGVEALRKKGSTIFKPALNCKFGVIIFDTSISLDPYGGKTEGEKKLRYFETVLRILVKGCAHYLYNENNKLKIKGIITDGDAWHRKIDEIRIFNKLLLESKSFVEIDPQAYIASVPKNPPENNVANLDKSRLLKLVDQLIGCVIQSCFRELAHGDKKEIIAKPVREMLDKRKRGNKFQASGHYRQFSISYAQLINKQWHFTQVDTRRISPNRNQLILPGLNGIHIYKSK
jgi:hypothetical protein